MTIDYVVKMGGSLLSDLAKASDFLHKLATVESTCVVTIGSGPLGDAFKAAADAAPLAIPFDLWVECWSGIQSVNARLIVSMHESFALCSSSREINECVAAGARPVVDAKDFAKDYKRLRYQMSDVRSALVAHLLDCRKLVIFTDVEGVFGGDPRTVPSARKLGLITAADPILYSRTSVDQGLAEQLIEHRITAFVTGIDSYLASDLPFADYLKSHSSVISPDCEPI